jgi:hypothetical protein
MEPQACRILEQKPALGVLEKLRMFPHIGVDCSYLRSEFLRRPWINLNAEVFLGFRMGLPRHCITDSAEVDYMYSTSDRFSIRRPSDPLWLRFRKWQPVNQWPVKALNTFTNIVSDFSFSN